MGIQGIYSYLHTWNHIDILEHKIFGFVGYITFVLKL